MNITRIMAALFLVTLISAVSVADQFGQSSAQYPGQGDARAHLGSASSPQASARQPAPSDTPQGKLSSRPSEQNPNPTDPAYPRYPYPPYRNPFYTEVSPKKIVAGAVDWILNLPTYVVNGVSSAVTVERFPAAPATHGANETARIEESDYSRAQEPVEAEQTEHRRPLKNYTVHGQTQTTVTVSPR